MEPKSAILCCEMWPPLRGSKTSAQDVTRPAIMSQVVKTGTMPEHDGEA